MSFLSGVWRLLGAEDEEQEHGRIVEYAAHPSTNAATAQKQADDGIISLPEAEQTTLFVVRPELSDKQEPQFSLKTYASYLLTRRALVLDINSLAADDFEQATRVVDYLTGVAEAVDSAVWEVTKNIFIFAPSNVQLAGDPLKPIEVF